MPDHYRVRIVPRASDDIVGICTYIEQQSPQNAASVARELLAAIDSLEIFPHRFKVHENRKDPTKTVHSMPVPPFIVYYRVVDRLRIVQVVTVRHGSQRQPKRFR